MNFFVDAFSWLADTTHWSGTNGIPIRIVEHLHITVLTIILAGAIALPVGILIGHRRRGAALIGGITGSARALPTLGLLTLFGLWLGIGLEAPLLALIILAIPSLLAGSYSGIQNIDPELPRAAQAIGMNHRQVICAVELPLALPVIIGGIRAATLQVVATATLAAYVSDFGLGRYLFAGLKTRDYPQMLAGSLLIIVLAIALELALALVQRFASTHISYPAHHQTTVKNSP